MLKILSLINIKRFLSFIFPPKCQYCKEVIPFGTLICRECLEKIKPQKHITKLVMESGREIFVISPFIYEKEIKQAICDFKFCGRVEFSEHLNKCITQTFKESYSVEDFDFITAVPLSSKSRKLRTYNQSEVLARGVAKNLNLTYVETLNKIKENKKQHTLSKEDRKENVKGVYEVFDKQNVLGKKIILCDDIVTTGSTLSECAKMLYSAGAETVCCMTAAKTIYCK